MDEHTHDEGRVSSPDGLSLYWQSWLPEEPRAILLFVHGLGEHSARYAHVASYFNDHGFGAYGLDYRAHGRSPGKRVHVDRFDQYLMDVGTIHTHMRRTHSGLPIFLVGHSQGGLIVLSYAMNYPRDLPGVVVSSPFLGIHSSVQPNVVEKVVAPILSWVLPKVLLPNKVDATFISHDPEVVRAYQADPMVSHQVSARWFF